MQDLNHRHPLLLAIYIPVLLFSTGAALLVAVLPLYVAAFDISYTALGIVLASNGIGTMIGDVPAGVLLRRYTIKTGMLAGLVLYGGMMFALFWLGSIWLVVLALLLAGVGRALFIVAWHAYLASAIAIDQRGRALSRMGGVFRAARAIGPVVGGAVAEVAGLAAPFLLTGVLCGVALAFVLLFTRQERAETTRGSAGLSHLGRGLWATFRAHYAILAASGVGLMLITILRNGRNTILPLYGADVLGLDVGAIGVLTGAASGADLLLFPVSGLLMDRLGRKYAIVPSLVIQSAGMALIPLTASYTALLGVSVLIGAGNGISAGTMLTLSSDLAPEKGRGDFIGLWHLLGDLGFAGGPFVVGTVADIVTLPVAALALSGAGVGAAWVFGRYVPETLKPRQRVAKLETG